ncbi:MAG: hypothetical protein GY730_11730 [bacterium]|nr:hypothetical protein [bacterium]
MSKKLMPDKKNDPGSNLPYEKRREFRGIIKHLMPFLTGDESEIVLAEVMIALKLEGLLGTEVTKKDSRMISLIKESILIEPEKKTEALKMREEKGPAL